MRWWICLLGSPALALGCGSGGGGGGAVTLDGSAPEAGAADTSAGADAQPSDAAPEAADAVSDAIVDAEPDVLPDAGCTPGAIESQSCGKCGTATRACSAAGSWEPFGACGGEGQCLPNETAQVSCGLCNQGTRVDTCDSACSWVAGNCTSPSGLCTPGDVKAGAAGCADPNQIQPETCQNDCSWGAAGACAAPPSGWRYMSSLTNFTFVGEQVSTAAWTGSEMIVWGRQNGGSSAVRAAYRPQTDKWRVLANDPIGQRIAHVAVWTGSRFIVWGGANVSGSACNADGAAYDPVANSWEYIPPATDAGGAFLPCRTHAVAVWSTTTGEMLVWGGASGAAYDSAGAAYHVATKKWRALPAAPIVGREQAKGFFAGGKLFVFGGLNGAALGDGAVFDPATSTWSAPSSMPALSPRHRVVAGADPAGTAGAFWGGVGTSLTSYAANGIFYDATSATWTSIPAPSTAIVPHAARAYAGGWVGQGKLWFWGGKSFYSNAEHWFGDGAAFDLATQTWTAIPAGGPTPRESPIVVWTGSEAIVWAGWVPGASGYDGRIYRP